MLRATGIVRKIDPLGRVVLPISVRKGLEIKENDPIELFVDEDGSIVLEKYYEKCIFCGSTDEVSMLKEKVVCNHCKKDLVRQI